MRSFSFRAGLFIFAALNLILIALRSNLYEQSLDAAYENTRIIINVISGQIDDGMHKYGLPYVHHLIPSILEDIGDEHLFLAMKIKTKVVGNLQPWPFESLPEDEWVKIHVAQNELLPSRQLLLKISRYPSGATVLVGYDLKRIELLRRNFPIALIQNIFLSLLLSFLLSVAILWQLNRHLFKINQACSQVMRGILSYRVATRQSGDQFDRLAVNFNRMLDWIVSLLGTVRDSTNAIAHDMRTPLSRHRLELQALSDDPAMPPPLKHKIHRAIRNVDDLSEMFDNILNIAQAESRVSMEIFEAFNFAEAVQDVVEFYAPLLETRSLTLEGINPECVVPVFGDKQLISQAVMNLVDNAVKYTPTDGRITITLGHEAAFATLAVADNGPGIPEALAEKAKERFFRLDASRHSKGSGLGLSLVSAVATLHQGTLELKDNHPGLRAIFRIPANIANNSSAVHAAAMERMA